MKKRILALLLALLLVFSLVSCAQKEDDKDDKKESSGEKKPAEENDLPRGEGKAQTPLLYRVTDEDGDVVWLFGSVHVGEESMYPFDEYITEALLGSDALAVEIDTENVSYSEMVEGVKLFLCENGTKTSDHLPAELYEDAKALMENEGIYNAAYEFYMPSYWFMLLSSLSGDSAGYDAEYGVDVNVMKLATEEGIEIRQIESFVYQCKMFADFSPELQEYLLWETLEGFGEMDAEMARELVEAWQKGDAETLRGAVSLEVPAGGDYEGLSESEEKAALEEYKKALLTDRDAHMADFAEQALEDGEEIFICVGAAHVVGEDGIVETLIERGYTVEDARPAA